MSSDQRDQETEGAPTASDAGVEERSASTVPPASDPTADISGDRRRVESVKDSRRREFGKRTASAAVYAAAMIAGLLINDYTTVVLVALLAGICSWEFYRMMEKGGHVPITALGIIASVLYPVVAWFGGRALTVSVTTILLAILLIWYVFSPRTKIDDLALTVFGALYCGLMLSCLVLLRTGEGGLAGGILAFGVVLSVWANDTFAYLVGSRIGRHKLAPKISPNKSWEGFFAGIIGSMIVWELQPFIVTNLSWPWATVAGLVCGVIAVFGDFVESRIKRGAGVKDSGKIMPGHGGMLDRCDSLIFASFAAYVILVFAGVV